MRDDDTLCITQAHFNG